LRPARAFSPVGWEAVVETLAARGYRVLAPRCAASRRRAFAIPRFCEQG